MIKDMVIYDKILLLLDEHKFKYQALSHPPVKTSADAAAIRDLSPDQGAKALVCFSDHKPIMVVLPGSKRLDTKSFKSKFAVKDLRFASTEELLQLTGLIPGAVPPFGHLFGLPTYLDTSLSGVNQIAFNAGDLTKSVIMNYSDYLKLASPIVGQFSVSY